VRAGKGFGEASQDGSSVVAYFIQCTLDIHGNVSTIEGASCSIVLPELCTHKRTHINIYIYISSTILYYIGDVHPLIIVVRHHPQRNLDCVSFITQGLTCMNYLSRKRFSVEHGVMVTMIRITHLKRQTFFI